MNLDLNETPERQIHRLERELEHVTGQLRLEHQGLLDWRKRCIKAESQVEKLQKQVDRLRAKHEPPPAKKIKSLDPADQVLSWEMESGDDADTEVQI